MSGVEKIRGEILKILQMVPEDDYCSLISYLGICTDLHKIHLRLVDYQINEEEREDVLADLEAEVRRCREFLLKNRYVK